MSILPSDISIVDYKPEYKTAFRDLNKEWIDTYFRMEPADYESLDHPEENIINKGGFIFYGIHEGKPIAVCTLKKMTIPDYDYELSKMAVTSGYQGLGIGKRLAIRVIEKAKELNARNVFIESNTILVPAINLYKKLGFKEVIGPPSPFERSNIQLELILNKDIGE